MRVSEESALGFQLLTSRARHVSSQRRESAPARLGTPVRLRVAGPLSLAMLRCEKTAPLARMRFDGSWRKTIRRRLHRRDYLFQRTEAEWLRKNPKRVPSTCVA